MEKLEYNYHTHTYRCGHAIGLDEEYVQEAIKTGIKRMGFSDHIFLPNFYQPRIRGSYLLLDDYLDSINRLREKYKDQIDIVVGFEAEYAPTYLDYYKDLLFSKKIDYLILGQHYKEINGSMYLFKTCEEYVDNVIAGLKTGLFKYIAHPDIFVMFNGGWDWGLEIYARRILKACKEYNIPIEINLAGLLGGREYPCDEFFEIAKEYDLDVVIGVDAHRPEQFNVNDFNVGIEFAKKHQLRLIELDIKKK
jgi:histidinol-phosphatase (PHP family)